MKKELIIILLALALFSRQNRLDGQSAGPAPVRVYRVTNAAAFPSLPMPINGMVFRNGVFQSPGIDYSSSGTQFTFYPNLLEVGDVLSVVAP